MRIATPPLNCRHTPNSWTPFLSARTASRRLSKSTDALLAAAAVTSGADYRARLPQDEVIYFVLPDRFENGDPSNDRGGLSGGRLQTGFDPTAKGFYHGGDLKGLIERLDYIQGLGATALWVAPIFKNKAVQGPPGHESAGYHGYWITDFTQVDPHFGTNADFKALVDAVHARSMKFYMDIVVNHTADVIYFQECVGKNDCPYRALPIIPTSVAVVSTVPQLTRGSKASAMAVKRTSPSSRIQIMRTR